MYNVTMAFKEMPTDGTINAFIDMVRVSHPLTIKINDITLEYSTPYGMGSHWVTRIEGSVGGQCYMQKHWTFNALKALLEKRFVLESAKSMPEPRKRPAKPNKLRRPPSKFTEVDA